MTYYRQMELSEINQVINLNLRQSDKDEIKASSGLPVQEALRLSIAASQVTWVVIHHGKIEGVFGLVLKNGFGIPWFLATNKFTEFSYTFAKGSKKVINEMLLYCSHLENYVDYRHIDSIKWLRWLGFTVDTSTPFALYDSTIPFFKFYLKEVDNIV